MAKHPSFDAVVIGGGPAGSAVARLLASWGHATLMLDSAPPRSRGLAESLPPSTRKLMAEVGVLDAVERAGFYRSTGNTVWWASDDPRVETFGSQGHATGYQVHRPDFDRVLRESARDAGASLCTHARVHDVRFDGDQSARVEYEEGGARRVASCRFVLDCSGRAGVVGRRFRHAEPGHGTLALVGVWRTSDGWDLADQTHTVVESHDEGWAWSVPVSATTRHVGAMIDRASRRAAGRPALESAYRAQIARTSQLRRLLHRASLQDVWACDASLYRSDVRRTAVSAGGRRGIVHRSDVVVRREEGARLGVARGDCDAHVFDAPGSTGRRARVLFELGARRVRDAPRPLR